ncbi:MAG TPA: hypothetical protein VNT24_02155 [Propionibacteriaceae bacterium]|nr:hypothetical protein [Propionibacteriaceae bacterium]
MPLCVQCPRTYARDEFRLVDSTGNQIAEPVPTVFERLAQLLERTPVLAHRAQNRRVQRALALQRLGATWRCPVGHVQPQDFRDVKSLVIGLIGPTATTKSSYLGSLLYQLTNHAILNDMGLRFTIMDEPSRRRWEQLYEGQLRGKHAPATTLRPGREEQTPPLVVRMTVQPPAGRDARYDLVFFDSAGEVQQTGHDVAVHSPFVQLMHAALLFYTPKALQFPRDVYRLPAEEQSQTAPGPSRVVGTFTTLQAQLSQHPAYIGKHPARDMPVAAVLSKADELIDLVDREFGGGGFSSLPLDGSYFHNPLQLQEQQGKLPYEITHRYDGAGILQAIEQLSRLRTFHAVSAMGCEPNELGVFTDYRPLNVAEPLLAVLHGLRRIGRPGSHV